MTSQTEPQTGTGGQAPLPRRLGWRLLLVRAGWAAAGTMAVVSAVLGDIEAAAVAVGFGLATGAVGWRRGTIGAAGVAVVSLVTLAFMSTAAVTNVRAGSDTDAVLISAGLTALSLAALAAAVGFLATRDERAPAGPWVVVAGSAAVFVVLFGWGALTDPAAEVTDGLGLVTENLAFSETSLTAEAGELRVAVANEDLFWHTFTIDELGVDLQVPVGAELSVDFEAPPGEYEFYCAIPGHAQAGMIGTLTIGG